MKFSADFSKQFNSGAYSLCSRSIMLYRYDLHRALQKQIFHFYMILFVYFDIKFHYLVSCGGFYLMIDLHDNQIKSVTNIQIFHLMSCHVLMVRRENFFSPVFPKYFEKYEGQRVFWHTDNSSGPFKAQIQINYTLHCLLR